MPYPQLPKSPELEIYDISSNVSTKLLRNGLYRVEVFLKLASLDYSRSQKLEGQDVPAIRDFAFDFSFECNENQECMVQSVPEFRSAAIRTERGIEEIKEEFQKVVVVRVKKTDKAAPQNQVQPASAVTPVGQGAPYERE